MSIYGYCRISTAKQSIDRQIRNIKAEYPTAHIVQEAYTGTSIFRPEWLKLYRILRAGDVVVFDSVSRMSRNAEEGFTLYEDLYHKGIRLVFLKEHHIDTETYKKSPVRQHCHDRDKCGLHLEGYQRVSDGLGKGADQTGL
jgi:DNA invertase Pin-like site-specific DNA recombinase